MGSEWGQCDLGNFLEGGNSLSVVERGSRDRCGVGLFLGRED